MKAFVLSTGRVTINYTPLWIAAILFSCMLGIMGTRWWDMKHPDIDLPEECRLIKPTDNLKGYWVNGVLHIEFNNYQNR